MGAKHLTNARYFCFNMADIEKFNRRCRRGFRRCLRVAYHDVPDAEIPFSHMVYLFKTELHAMVDSGEMEVEVTDDIIIKKRQS